MSDNRKNNGGHSTKALNPNDKRLASKTDRQEVYELLNPYTKDAVKKHAQAIKAGERWAIELFYKYQFGMPTQVIDQTTKLELRDFDISELYDSETSK